MRRVLSMLALLVVLGSIVPLSAAQAERLQVVASFSILADTAARVAGDAADVTSLIPVGADPHSFSPSPRDIAAIADADVVFINGINFEEMLLEAIENAGGDFNLVIASSCVDVLSTGATSHEHEHEGEDEHDHEAETMTSAVVDPALASRCEQHIAEMAALHEAGHDHSEEAHSEMEASATAEVMATEEAAEHDHEHSKVERLGRLYTITCEEHDHEAEPAEEDGHSHEAGSCDPHVWTDPHNVIYWTYMIRDTLITLDPANTDTYTANATAYAAELDALAHDFMRPMLDSVPEESRILVTSHETLGYLAAYAGYEVVATIIPGGATGAEPGAADIASLIDLIKEEGVPAIFAENTVSSGIAEQVAAESGAAFYTLLSDSLAPEGEPGSTYMDYMQFNVTTIVEALGGGLSD